jgi:predicted TIM-barrel fold metal-dependent hydrolase
MTAKNFLKEAREKISDNPFSRVGPVAFNAINDPNCIFDIHNHIFDRQCLNIKYIALRMARSAINNALGIESDEDFADKLDLLIKSDESMYEEIAKGLPETAADWAAFEAEINIIQELEKYELFGYKWSDLKQAIDVLTKDSMAAVFNLYSSKYALNNSAEFRGRPMVSGILMMDLETGWNMPTKKKLWEQVEELQNLATTQPVLPFFAVDPRRADLTDESENLYSLFIKAFTEGPAQFFGVKCYPALGYLPSDKRLDPIFQICKEKNIPITTHCGGTIVSTYEKTIQVQNSKGQMIDFEIPGNDRKERADFLNNPAQWDTVLQKYKKLKVNLAHFGGDDNWLEISQRGSNGRVEKVLELIADPRLNVYTDFSYNLVEDNLYESLHQVVNTRADIAAKMLYGTDFWVVLPSGDLVRKQDDFIAKFSAFKNAFTMDNPNRFLFEKPKTVTSKSKKVLV